MSKADLYSGCWMYKPRSVKANENALQKLANKVGGSAWNKRYVWTTDTNFNYGSKMTFDVENTIVFAKIIEVRAVDRKFMISQNCPDHLADNGWAMRTEEKDLLWAALDAHQRDRYVAFFQAALRVAKTGYEEAAVRALKEQRLHLNVKGPIDRSDVMSALETASAMPDDEDLGEDDDDAFRYDWDEYSADANLEIDSAGNVSNGTAARTNSVRYDSDKSPDSRKSGVFPAQATVREPMVPYAGKDGSTPLAGAPIEGGGPSPQRQYTRAASSLESRPTPASAAALHATQRAGGNTLFDPTSRTMSVTSLAPTSSASTRSSATIDKRDLIDEWDMDFAEVQKLRQPAGKPPLATSPSKRAPAKEAPAPPPPKPQKPAKPVGETRKAVVSRLQERREERKKEAAERAASASQPPPPTADDAALADLVEDYAAAYRPPVRCRMMAPMPTGTPGPGTFLALPLTSFDLFGKELVNMTRANKEEGLIGAAIGCREGFALKLSGAIDQDTFARCVVALRRASRLGSGSVGLAMRKVSKVQSNLEAKSPKAAGSAQPQQQQQSVVDGATRASVGPTPRESFAAGTPISTRQSMASPSRPEQQPLSIVVETETGKTFSIAPALNYVFVTVTE